MDASIAHLAVIEAPSAVLFQYRRRVSGSTQRVRTIAVPMHCPSIRNSVPAIFLCG